ncbi:Secreted effector protein PipB2 [termite gut metagenome]|uniref:Secreted effector protein PipB2 n=1 Tax=termite gut metagenome TaxID=433724 RepID=A0A5J4QPF4_9ZZZZ
MKKSFKQKYLIIIALVIFFSPIIGVILGNSIIPCWQFFNHLHTVFGLDSQKDFFTFWIALFGAIGIAINIYHNQKRIRLQEKQLQKQDEQLQKQQKHIDVLSKTQQDGRFAKGVELLGNASESARTGAAYNLFFLAKEFPEEYSKSVFEILCSHIRTNTNDKEYQDKYKTSPSNEIQTIVDLLFRNYEDEQYPFLGYEAILRNSFLAGCDLGSTYLKGAYLTKANLENANLRQADLEGAHFKKAYLWEVNLERANLWETHLEGASLWKAHLEGADLRRADLSEANLEEADLSYAYLEDANLEGTNLKGVDLDKARNLDKALNVDETSLPEGIIWHPAPNTDISDT